MDLKSVKSQLILFLVITYAYLWLLFGVGKLFDIPFSYDFREPGGIPVFVGVPAILFHASVDFLAFAIHYPYRYFYWLWGITAIIAAVFLPRSPVGMGERSGLDDCPDA